jgi:hypothetical protein
VEEAAVSACQVLTSSSISSRRERLAAIVADAMGSNADTVCEQRAKLVFFGGSVGDGLFSCSVPWRHARRKNGETGGI